MLTPQMIAGNGAINGLFYIAEGAPAMSALEAYDAIANSWLPLHNSPTARSGVGSAAVGGKLYVMGGCNNTDCNNVSSALQVYDPTTDTWTTKAPMLTAVDFMQVGQSEPRSMSLVESRTAARVYRPLRFKSMTL
jgi:N-acetylneuraminic acid mutarotase